MLGAVVETLAGVNIRQPSFSSGKCKQNQPKHGVYKKTKSNLVGEIKNQIEFSRGKHKTN